MLALNDNFFPGYKQSILYKIEKCTYNFDLSGGM